MRTRVGGILALVLAVGAAGCANAAAICAAAGGTYEGDTCTRPGYQAAEAACSRGGAIYLKGEERCVLGSGGP